MQQTYKRTKTFTIMQEKNEEKVEKIEKPTELLNKLRVGQKTKAPNVQRLTFETTILRMKNKGEKRFTLKKENELFFTIKRTQ